MFTKRELKRRPCAWLRLAAERANEVPDDVLAKRRAKVIAKNQAKRAQEQAWEAARQAKNAIAINNNLAQAEAETDKVKSVTPYVAASYIDKDEEKRLKGQGSQRAWAAVNVQEQAKKNASGVGKTTCHACEE